MTDYKKLYEDAIFRMNKWVEGSEIIDPKEVAEFVFPELAEYEDERTRKEIIDFVKSRGGFKGEWIAWLEKHGEHANFINKIQIGDKVTRNEDGVLVNLSQLKRVAKKDEKQGEQKSADKVEPKFKVGDWVKAISSGNIFKILSVNDGLYRVLCYDGVEANYPIEVEKDLAYWTIKDAKDGDMIATKYFIFIFKNIDSNNGVHYYCQYEIIKYEDDNQFDTALPESLMGKVGSTYYSPATKEQRDTLMKAMTDAGYTFDFEKKELKKIEQKPAWSEEEDETVLNNLIYALANDIIGNCSDEYVDWRKSLKGRILKFEK